MTEHGAFASSVSETCGRSKAFLRGGRLFDSSCAGHTPGLRDGSRVLARPAEHAGTDSEVRDANPGPTNSADALAPATSAPSRPHAGVRRPARRVVDARRRDRDTLPRRAAGARPARGAAVALWPCTRALTTTTARSSDGSCRSCEPCARNASPDAEATAAERRSRAAGRFLRRVGRALERHQQVRSVPSRAWISVGSSASSSARSFAMCRGAILIDERVAASGQPDEHASAVGRSGDSLDQPGLLEPLEAVRHRSRRPHEPAIQLGRRPLEGGPARRRLASTSTSWRARPKARHQRVRRLVEVRRRAADARDDRHRARVEFRARLTPLCPPRGRRGRLAVWLNHLQLKVPL